jgi:four helix bundle protein
MKYHRFEDLPVSKDSAELARRMYEFSSSSQFNRPFWLARSVRTCRVVVSNNIAEGFERGSTNELLAFLYIARGSAGEVRSMLKVLDGWSDFSNLKSQISDLIKSIRENLKTAVWLDRKSKKLRNLRTAAPR